MGSVNGKQRELSQEDLDYILQHTSMTKEEVESKYEIFKENHPNGKLSKAAFHELMTNCYPGLDVENIEKHIFRMYDLNHDGEIDFREFMILLYIMSNASAEQNLKQIFRLLDINNDGFISCTELKHIVNDFFKLVNTKDIDVASNELFAQNAFLEMDENKDGKVSLAEFQNAVLAQKEFSSMFTIKIIEAFVE